MRSRSSLNAGFTLVEVMVSIAVLSMILLATVTALRTFGNTQQSLQHMTHRVDEVRSVSGFLRAAIESATIAEDASGGLALGGTGGGGRSGGFLGNEQALQWKSVLLFGEGYGGSFLLRVAREEDRLMLRWLDEELRLGRQPDWTSAEGWPLVEGLQEFSIAYRGDVGQEWLPEWVDGSSPGWLRMTIRSKNRYWPELIMRVPQ